MAGKKQYKYTVYKQDGAFEDLGIGPKKNFKDFYKILNCSMIEHIPHDYYPDKSGHAEFWGDEEGRFNEDNYTNPHFKAFPGGWDVVGDVLKEEVYHGKNR